MPKRKIKGYVFKQQGKGTTCRRSWLQWRWFCYFLHSLPLSFVSLCRLGVCCVWPSCSLSRWTWRLDSHAGEHGGCQSSVSLERVYQRLFLRDTSCCLCIHGELLWNLMKSFPSHSKYLHNWVFGIRISDEDPSAESETLMLKCDLEHRSFKGGRHSWLIPMCKVLCMLHFKSSNAFWWRLTLGKTVKPNLGCPHPVS